MPILNAKTIPKEEAPTLSILGKFAEASDGDRGSWTHVDLAEDDDGKAWLVMTRGSGLGRVLTECMCLTDIMWDWEVYANIWLMITPGGDEASGV